MNCGGPWAQKEQRTRGRGWPTRRPLFCMRLPWRSLLTTPQGMTDRKGIKLESRNLQQESQEREAFLSASPHVNLSTK